MGERRWATKTQAAEHAVVHPNTIDNWVAAGLVRAYKFGPRLVRYDLGEIDAMPVPTSPLQLEGGTAP